MSRKESRAKHKQTLGKFRSGFEKAVDANIRKSFPSVEYESVTYTFPVAIRNGICLACDSKVIARFSSYTPDFKIKENVYIEAKGKFTPGNRTRLLAFQEEHSQVTIYLLFQRDNWCTSRKLQRYSQWAKKHGFGYAIGEIPPTAWFQ